MTEFRVILDSVFFVVIFFLFFNLKIFSKQPFIFLEVVISVFCLLYIQKLCTLFYKKISDSYCL